MVLYILKFRNHNIIMINDDNDEDDYDDYDDYDFLFTFSENLDFLSMPKRLLPRSSSTSSLNFDGSLIVIFVVLSGDTLRFSVSNACTRSR